MQGKFPFLNISIPQSTTIGVSSPFMEAKADFS
jgi:hypothetical protein